MKTPLGEDATLPSRKPDGSQIAFEQFGSVRTLDLATGRVRRLLAGPSGNPERSPDGSTIGFSAVRQIGFADADGSGRRPIEESNSDWQTWSPDGSQIAYNRYRDLGGESAIWLCDVASGQRRLFMEHAENLGWKDADTMIVHVWG